LDWHRFEQKSDGHWWLCLPPFYAGLFAARLPILFGKSNTGFRNSRTGQTKFAFFPELAEKDLQKINAFIQHYSRVVALGMNDYIRGSFGDELDLCLALDLNKPEPGPKRTAIGELEYQAKYHRDQGAISELVRYLGAAVVQLPRRLLPKPRLLTFVPSDPGSDFCLPAILVEALLGEFDESFWGVPAPLVRAVLKASKKSAKNVTVEQKLALWKSIIEEKGVRLSRDVAEHSVIVVDDLYQSGASLWSFAKYLKARGAATVIGLVCVKSLRDTDNQ
jgi:predicted amidophosphoribosyltransferase